jgi:hypothetical protein
VENVIKIAAYCLSRSNLLCDWDLAESGNASASAAGAFALEWREMKNNNFSIFLRPYKFGY